MTNVILSINGTEVFNKSISGSTSTTPEEQYIAVPYPSTGNEYYYMKKDEYDKPIYKKSKLTNIDYEADGPNTSVRIYTFEDGYITKDTIFNRSDSGGGGKIKKKKNFKEK